MIFLPIFSAGHLHRGTKTSWYYPLQDLNFVDFEEVKVVIWSKTVVSFLINDVS